LLELRERRTAGRRRGRLYLPVHQGRDLELRATITESQESRRLGGCDLPRLRGWSRGRGIAHLVRPRICAASDGCSDGPPSSECGQSPDA
jgi:hypothetical protein